MMKKSAFCKLLAFFVVFVLAIPPVCAKSVNFAVISDVHYNDGNAKGAKADAKKILKGAVQRKNGRILWFFWAIILTGQNRRF